MVAYDDYVFARRFIVTNSTPGQQGPSTPTIAARNGLGCLVILAVAVVVGAVLLRNGPLPSVPVRLPVATSTIAASTNTGGGLQQALQNALAADATPFPTVVPRAMPTSYVAPTLPPIGTPALVPPDQAYVPAVASPTRDLPVTVTLPGPTSVPSPTSLDVVNRNPNLGQGQWSLPPQQVPMSHDPRDHFYFRRPVDANANSTSLFYYPYGSAGPQLVWRVHHGLDMPNPDGQAVRAAAEGVVVWASDHYRWVEDKRVVDAAESYGNVVIVAHNFGYRGAQLYTLYAHLSKILVSQNQTVTAGQVVGLSGHSGQVSGPHVHFEVREGDNLYFDTRNPLLWMAPLVGDGIVAGRILYRDGSPVQNATISLIQNNRVVDTTYTYLDPNEPNSTHHQVDGDDQWHENFVIGDVPAGHYQVSVSVGGYRLIQEVDVQDGTTAFADFGTSPAPPEIPPLTPYVPG